MRPLLLAALFLSANAAAVPLELTHQGRLLDSSSSPLTGDHTVTVSLYATESSTDVLWTEDHGTLPFEGGYYGITLGSIEALDADLFDGSVLWVGLEVDGASVPRLPIRSVPYALRSQAAVDLDGGTVNAQTITVGDLVIDASGLSVGGSTVISSNGAVSGADWADLQNIPDDINDGDQDALADLAVTCSDDEIVVVTSGLASCASPITLTISADNLQGTVPASALQFGDSAATVAEGDHNHPAEDIVSGTLDVALLPVGTTDAEVAAGDHSHNLADLDGTLTIGDVSSSCDSNLLGAVRFADDTFEGCTSSGWVVLGRGGKKGESADDAGSSCQQIRDDHNGSDGVYWIDPDGSGSLEARELYCDMTGGGWTLVAGLGNRWAKEPAPGHFFTGNITQSDSGWTDNSDLSPLRPQDRGVVRTDNWPDPSEIRFQNVHTASGDVKNEVRCEGDANITHLRTYTDERDARAGSATCFSVPFNEERTFYLADDHQRTWYYWGGIMGRSHYTPGWQFGLSVNQADNTPAYDNVHDDSGRAEYNLGVGAHNTNQNYDITGYWQGSPGCTSGCNEDWAGSVSANYAVTYVWYR